MKKRDINLQNLQIFSDLSTEEIDVFKDELNIMILGIISQFGIKKK